MLMSAAMASSGRKLSSLPLLSPSVRVSMAPESTCTRHALFAPLAATSASSSADHCYINTGSCVYTVKRCDLGERCTAHLLRITAKHTTDKTHLKHTDTVLAHLRVASTLVGLHWKVGESVLALTPLPCLDYFQYAIR